MDVGKIGLGTGLLLVSASILAANGTVSSPVPLYAVVLVPLGLAAAVSIVVDRGDPA